eukprot:GHVP01029584.1.p1 GENE.GHVP01029584.1~~GHVP01029584.1.p1  ORF type:complete len:283 (+),score=58.65 GHVP01029584.1:2162-3010(+)
MSSEQLDSMFMAILEKQMDVEAFVGSFFGFMARRTDFFYILEAESQNAGFVPGYAWTIVKRQFLASQAWSLKNKQPHLQEKQKELNKTSNIVKERTSQTKPSPNVPLSLDSNNRAIPADSYNGAKFDFYAWSQTISEVNAEAWLPDSEKFSKSDVLVTLKKQYLKVKIKEVLLIDTKLPYEINVDQSTWLIEDNKKFCIQMAKCQEVWWDKLCSDENGLAMKNVESTKKFENCDDEVKASIRKLMFDQQQKRRGLPTSDEQNLEEILEKAKYKEGSPFLPSI